MYTELKSIKYKNIDLDSGVVSACGELKYGREIESRQGKGWQFFEVTEMSYF
jgi:hypothetical protein